MAQLVAGRPAPYLVATVRWSFAGRGRPPGRRIPGGRWIDRDRGVRWCVATTIVIASDGEASHPSLADPLRGPARPPAASGGHRRGGRTASAGRTAFPRTARLGPRRAPGRAHPRHRALRVARNPHRHPVVGLMGIPTTRRCADAGAPRVPSRRNRPLAIPDLGLALGYAPIAGNFRTVSCDASRSIPSRVAAKARAVAAQRESAHRTVH